MMGELGKTYIKIGVRSPTDVVGIGHQGLAGQVWPKASYRHSYH